MCCFQRFKYQKSTTKSENTNSATQFFQKSANRNFFGNQIKKLPNPNKKSATTFKNYVPVRTLQERKSKTFTINLFQVIFQ